MGRTTAPSKPATLDELTQLLDGDARLVDRRGGQVILSADVVEVSPPYDSAQLTALAGATIALDVLHLMALTR